MLKPLYYILNLRDELCFLFNLCVQYVSLLYCLPPSALICSLFLFLQNLQNLRRNEIDILASGTRCCVPPALSHALLIAELQRVLAPLLWFGMVLIIAIS